jgi:hypothetical protein
MTDLGLSVHSSLDVADYEYVFSQGTAKLEIRLQGDRNDAGTHDWRELSIEIFQLGHTSQQGSIPIVDASSLVEARREGDLYHVATVYRDLVAQRREEGGPFAVVVYCPMPHPETPYCLWSKDAEFATDGQLSYRRYQTDEASIWVEPWFLDLVGTARIPSWGRLEVDIVHLNNEPSIFSPTGSNPTPSN